MFHPPLSIIFLFAANQQIEGEALGLSPDAQIDTFEMMREDLAQIRHASDGGGRARARRVAVAGIVTET